MTCIQPMPKYANPPFRGCRFAGSRGDGYTIDIRWFKATPYPYTYLLAYNIYFSTNKEDVFSEGVKFVVTDSTLETIALSDLTPGDVYYFAVRSTEFEPGTVNLNQLPGVGTCKIYPEAALTSDISDSSLIIPVMDADQFPAMGIVQIGAELIAYSNLDIPLGQLVLADISQRGLYGTQPRLHTTGGWDGYRYYDNPLVRFFLGFEDDNGAIELAENRFDYPNYPRTNADGYMGRVDIINKDFTSVEAANNDFPPYDFSGWRRNDPADVLAGKCLGTYIGGEMYCADGYDGVGRRVRGVSTQDQMTGREEVLLNTTGFACMLFKRIWDGKVSKHYTNHKMNTAHRGLDNFGTAMAGGYEQYWDARHNDGCIRVRFAPMKEDIERGEAGLENKVTADCWTLVVPVIKDGDFIIRYNKDGTEEFRYEIIDVTRNDTTLMNSGLQKFTAVRVRKTDPIYQVRAFADIGNMPAEISTGIGGVSGPGGMPPHIHMIRLNEHILHLSQLNETTSVSQGHSHQVVNGVIDSGILGHSHSIILP